MIVGKKIIKKERKLIFKERRENNKEFFGVCIGKLRS